MLKIQFSENIPDSTYFTTGECEPQLKGETLTVYNGEGTRRGWGRPGVTSTIVFESTDIIAIHIGFHHKHRGGQFWRFYQINGEVKQVEWKSLDDDTRAAILEAYDKNAPNWAKIPGKLRKDYQPANPKKNLFTAYKMMGLDGEQLTSLYDPSEIYTLGKAKVQASKPDHNGGWYVFGDAERLQQLYADGNLVPSDKFQPRAALVKCECWGNVINYRNGKMAVTYCKPVEVVDVFEVAYA